MKFVENGFFFPHLIRHLYFSISLFELGILVEHAINQRWKIYTSFDFWRNIE